MINQAEIKTVFVGDVAFNTDITPHGTRTSIGGAAYYCAAGAIAAAHTIDQLKAVGIVATVGDDFDLDPLAQENIDLRGTSVISGGKTCEFTLTQHLDNSREFEARRNVADPINTQTFPSDYEGAKHIHLATSLPQNYQIWQTYLRDRTHAIISADAFEAFALEFPELSIIALNNADLIFINEAEANILSKSGQLRTNVPWVFKHGRDGAEYIDGSKLIRVRAPKVRAVENTGAGDVLAGAFLNLLSHGYDTEHALTIAVGIASDSVTQFGVEHLLKKPLSQR